MREDGQPLQLTCSHADIERPTGRLLSGPQTVESHLTELEQILSKSQAADAFKKAVRSYCASGGAEHIRVEGFAPMIKVKRLLAHMLTAEPHLEIERISLRARSGCSDFIGTVQVHTTDKTHSYEFIWDCRWRAEQQGWKDCFGFPDQIRAAREYDWRCFERWESVSA